MWACYYDGQEKECEVEGTKHVHADLLKQKNLKKFWLVRNIRIENDPV
jgi:hypothetical protein